MLDYPEDIYYINEIHDTLKEYKVNQATMNLIIRNLKKKSDEDIKDFYNYLSNNKETDMKTLIEMSE